MKSHLTPKAALILGAFLATASVFLLTFVTPGIVSGDADRQIEPFEDFACLDCHTDKQRLTELAPAQEQEEEESLSSGPG